MPLLEQDGGFVCEFGVATGRSLWTLQEILPLNTTLHGFDTFRVVWERGDRVLNNQQFTIHEEGVCISFHGYGSRKFD